MALSGAEIQRRYRARMKAWLYSLKTKPCMDCGQQYPAECMEFDHLYDKAFTIGNMIYKLPLEQIRREVAKCEVVCSNCHRLRTTARRTTQNTVIATRHPVISQCVLEL